MPGFDAVRSVDSVSHSPEEEIGGFPGDFYKAHIPIILTLIPTSPKVYCFPMGCAPYVPTFL
jgi:hypothetical protein